MSFLRGKKNDRVVSVHIFVFRAVICYAVEGISHIKIKSGCFEKAHHPVRVLMELNLSTSRFKASSR